MDFVTLSDEWDEWHAFTRRHPLYQIINDSQEMSGLVMSLPSRFVRVELVHEKGQRIGRRPIRHEELHTRFCHGWSDQLLQYVCNCISFAFFSNKMNGDDKPGIQIGRSWINVCHWQLNSG